MNGSRCQGAILLLNDCYNANPISMRAAIENLAVARDARGGRLAVLGGMAELGPDGPGFPRARSARSPASSGSAR